MILCVFELLIEFGLFKVLIWLLNHDLLKLKTTTDTKYKFRKNDGTCCLALKASQVTNVYQENGVKSLTDFSLEIVKGEIVGIIGPNGAGKSTLFKVLSMMTQRKQGTVTILGE